MKNPKTPAQRPHKAPSNQTGGTAWGKKLAAEISRMALNSMDLPAPVSPVIAVIPPAGVSRAR